MVFNNTQIQVMDGGLIPLDGGGVINTIANNPTTPVVPLGTPLTPTGQIPTGITPPLVPLIPPIVDQPPTPTGLASFIAMSIREVDADYTKDSLSPIPQQIISINNFSDVYDMNVSIRGTAGVTFDPEDFFLPNSTLQSILVNFDPGAVNQLPDGINVVSCVISLSSDTVVENPPFPPPPPTPVVPPNAGTFLEERFVGSSGDNGKQSPDVIFAKAPAFTQRINAINYDDRKLSIFQIIKNTKITSPLRIDQRITVRWSGNFLFDTAGTYKFTITTDDGMRIKIDNNSYFFNQYKNQNPTPYTATVNIDTAGYHLVTVEYYNDVGNNTAMVSWALVPGTGVTPPTPPGTTTPTTPVQPTTPNSPLSPTNPQIPTTPLNNTPPTTTIPPVIPTPPPTVTPPSGGGGGGGAPPTTPVIPTTPNPPIIPPITPPTPITPPIAPKSGGGGNTAQ